MNRLLTAIGLLSLCISLSAQPGAIETRKANHHRGKMLTMDEAILSRDLLPENLYCEWYSDHEIVMFENGEWKIFDINKRMTFPYKGRKSQTEEISVYTEDQALYCSLPDGNVITIAKSENPNITFGEAVSRNEFGIEDGIFLAPDSSKVAFYRKDETKVSTFPLFDITTRTGSTEEIKYPMAGMDSENVKVGVYNFKTSKMVYLSTPNLPYDSYLTNISWTPDASKILVQVLDRSQKNMSMNVYNATNGKLLKTLFTEHNDKYVEPTDPVYFLQDSPNVFIYRTDNRDGYKNLYLCDMNGNIRRLTATDADVQYVANDGKHVWYTSAEVSPIENHLFRIKITPNADTAWKGVEGITIGTPQRLTQTEGWHEIKMSPDCKHYIDTWSSLTVPNVIDLCHSDGSPMRNLLIAEDPTLGYAYTEIVLGKVKSADGKYDNYYRLIKPKDFNPKKKYPVILYVYGGPHSQMVKNSFLGELRRWEMYMAQRGYLVYVQDNRGTQNRGAEYEKAIHGQCGQAEMADQMEGIKMLMRQSYVDKERIGVHGWSYGGFMTISLMTNYPNIFKVGVAGGPVIDWKWYEVMYGERYMGHPDENPEGYEKTSLINKAADLKGKLLICQGVIDPVVLWQHSLSFVRACVMNNVQVDYFPYPRHEHNVMGKDRVHLHNKISMYFTDYL